MPRVLIADYAWDSLDIERGILAEVDAELVVAETGEEAELISLAGDVDAIMVNWRRAPAAVLEAAERCIAVARYGVGLDNIDVARATELGMVVTNVPDFCVDEVAEHALALILALQRKIVLFASQTRAGQWDNTAFGQMHRLRGQTIGLIGTGLLAQGLAQRCRALGLEVIAHSRSAVPGSTKDGMTFADSLDDLLERSDIVSLHVPLTEATRHMISTEQLARMKSSAFLINTARGPVVDPKALVEALRSGAIAGAGIDVTEPEPIEPGDPLLQMDNAIVTPHAAFYSYESTIDLQTRAATSVKELLAGRVPDTVVNAQVLSAPELRATNLRTAS
ncbi:MAG TPA: C-terminal binding protein [Baekduia sp.]|nr:C-terminal binding protein [Baekduia sp.]